VNDPNAFRKILTGRLVTGPVSARMTIDGRPYLNFYGAGYLALSNVPEIRNAVRELLEHGAPFAQQLPASHGAIDPVFTATQQAGARALGTEASLYFASGYLIGSVGVACIEEPFDAIAIDESAHFNLQDAAKLTQRPILTFAHCDADALADVLRDRLRPGQRPLLLTDGAFATTGRIPPLAEYAVVLARLDGRMFIDESHAFGVVGETGRGAAEYCRVEHIASRGATLSKAYCAQGAIVGCSPSSALRSQGAMPMGGANAGSPLSAAAATASLRYVAEHPELRRNLQATTEHLRARLREIGLDVIDSPAPIVSFAYSSRAQMLALQRRAFDRGLYLHYSSYIGAGPEGKIRCAVFADHTAEDIDRLIGVLREIL
jgi:8-amino-7-oxononanoate synthase